MQRFSKLTLTHWTTDELIQGLFLVNDRCSDMSHASLFISDWLYLLTLCSPSCDPRYTANCQSGKTLHVRFPWPNLTWFETLNSWSDVVFSTRTLPDNPLLKTDKFSQAEKRKYCCHLWLSWEFKLNSKFATVDINCYWIFMLPCCGVVITQASLLSSGMISSL